MRDENERRRGFAWLINTGGWGYKGKGPRGNEGGRWEDLMKAFTSLNAHLTCINFHNSPFHLWLKASSPNRNSKTIIIYFTFGFSIANFGFHVNKTKSNDPILNFIVVKLLVSVLLIIFLLNTSLQYLWVQDKSL